MWKFWEKLSSLDETTPFWGHRKEKKIFPLHLSQIENGPTQGG